MSDIIRFNNSHHRSRKRYQWSPTVPRGRASRNDILDASPKARQIAHLRLAILKAFHAEISINERPKTQAMREFLEIFNLGMILPETLTTISHISRSTLYSWEKKYRDGGFAALIPRYGYGYKEKPGADLAFIKLFRTYRKIVIPGNPRSRGKREFLPQLGRQWHGSPLEGPVMVGIFFSMPVPKGTRMGRRMKMLRHQISHTRPPSLDRLIDFTLDCMNGIIFSDRSQIIRFHAEKEYRWNPEIRIFVRALSK